MPKRSRIRKNKNPKFYVEEEKFSKRLYKPCKNLKIKLY